MKPIYPQSGNHATAAGALLPRSSIPLPGPESLAQKDGAAVVQIGPELPSPEAADATVDRLAGLLAAEPGKALRSVGNLDQSRISRLLQDD